MLANSYDAVQRHVLVLLLTIHETEVERYDSNDGQPQQKNIARFPRLQITDYWW